MIHFYRITLPLFLLMVVPQIFGMERNPPSPRTPPARTKNTDAWHVEVMDKKSARFYKNCYKQNELTRAKYQQAISRKDIDKNNINHPLALEYVLTTIQLYITSEVRKDFLKPAACPRFPVKKLQWTAFNNIDSQIRMFNDQYLQIFPGGLSEEFTEPISEFKQNLRDCYIFIPDGGPK